MNEWENEPDELRWVDEKTGMDCLILRHPSLKHLCGYVRVPFIVQPGCSWCNCRHTTPNGKILGEIRVHGGITFDGKFEHLKDLSIDGFWYGFDCAHSGDFSPGTLKYGFVPNETYRNIAYVKAECEKLAEQLSKLRIEDEPSVEEMRND